MSNKISAEVQEKSYSKLRRYLHTIEHVSKKIPGALSWSPGDMKEYYSTANNSNADDILKELRTTLRRDINGWITKSDRAEIEKIVSTINPKARGILQGIVRPAYRVFFDSEFKALPNDFACPSPFLLINRKAGRDSVFNRPLIRKYGQTRMKLSGTIMIAEDGKTTFALSIIRRQREKEGKTKRTEKNIHFQTSLVEINKTLQKANPYAKDALNATWKSLERLRGCVITLTNIKGLRTLGGILDGAKEVNQESNQVDIYLDRGFVELIEEGYISLNPDVYFKLRSREANLYAYLQRQKSFNLYGHLRPVSIRNVYDASGLGGLNPEGKATCQKRYELNKTLKGLEKRELIGKWKIKDKLEITFACPDGVEFNEEMPDCKECKYFERCKHKEEVKESNKLLEGQRLQPDKGVEEHKTKKKADNKCPHGRTFNKDYFLCPDNLGCELASECEEGIEEDL